MRKTLALICTTIVLGISLISGSAQAANQGPFLGTWTSVDTDGSDQWLRINGGGSDHYAMYLYDESATVACGGAPARVTGSGTADGDDLLMRGALTCAPGGNVVRGRLALDFHFDSATDTLTDFSGVVWHRS
jgi:hypothetical protein